MAIKFFRREITLYGKRRNLEKVNSRTNLVSGNYIPLLDSDVIKEISERFDKTNLVNPIKKDSSTLSTIVIHYRLGDMRKYKSRADNLGGHGIVSPETFKKVLEYLNLLGKHEVQVVSDEVEIAKKLLNEVGLNTAKVSIKTHSAFDDLKIIGNSKVFIGSVSQFSIFAGTICSYNGGKVYLPTNAYGVGDWEKDFSVSGFNYFECEYLPPTHWLFNLEQ